MKIELRRHTTVLSFFFFSFEMLEYVRVENLLFSRLDPPMQRTKKKCHFMLL